MWLFLVPVDVMGQQEVKCMPVDVMGQQEFKCAAAAAQLHRCQVSSPMLVVTVALEGVSHNVVNTWQFLEVSVV